MNHPVNLDPSSRQRVRELGICPGVLTPGKLNAITDLENVRVGHFSLNEGADIRTGVTAILPHEGNIYQDKVPAAIIVGNGYGKLLGSTQVNELGELESPILLTNTLDAPRAADAIIEWTLSQAGNESVKSVNAVAGETNDGFLNNIRKRALQPDHFLKAIANSTRGPVSEGSIGAGSGTIAFGWKGGIGTSSRHLPAGLGGFKLGVLVQSNFGGILQMDGLPVGKLLDQYFLKDELASESADGSIIIILATDAPLSDRNLKRLGKRALSGLARTGAAMSNGSGDYVIAFSTAESVRRTAARREKITAYPELPNEQLSPLFQAAIEATEEAIYNSICMATSVEGYMGTIPALPLDKVEELIASRSGRG